jgi:hypothetical protein
MELRDSAPAAHRFIHKLFGGSGRKRYAVEVDGSYAEVFDIPGTELREYGKTQTTRLCSFLNREMTCAPRLGKCQAFDVSA